MIACSCNCFAISALVALSVYMLHHTQCGFKLRWVQMIVGLGPLAQLLYAYMGLTIVDVMVNQVRALSGFRNSSTDALCKKNTLIFSWIRGGIHHELVKPFASFLHNAIYCGGVVHTSPCWLDERFRHAGDKPILSSSALARDTVVHC